MRQALPSAAAEPSSDARPPRRAALAQASMPHVLERCGMPSATGQTGTDVEIKNGAKGANQLCTNAALKKPQTESSADAAVKTERRYFGGALAVGDKRIMQSPQLQAEDASAGDARAPPQEELVAAAGAAPRPVCFDLEATGLEPGARMLQLAAFQPRAPAFSRYVLPPPGAAMESGAVRATGLDLRRDFNGHRQLFDVRAGEALPTVSEREALLDFVAWLRALGPAGGGAGDGAAGGEGVVLVSHGAILLDVPVLVAAVRDTGLEQPFYKVVRGFCDSQAVFQASPCLFRSMALDALYEQVVGKPLAGAHRADVDARHLHELLCAHLGTEELSLAREPRLARFAYSARCMRRFARWKAEWCDAHWGELWATVGSAQRPGRAPRSSAVKPRRVLVRNLLAAGYDLEGLRGDWARGGRPLVLARVQLMKAQRESYLTDSRCLSAEEVADRVADYFAGDGGAAALAALPPGRRRGLWRPMEY